MAKIITFLYIGSALLLISCNRNNSSQNGSNSKIENTEYLSIEGLWIATLETSQIFPDGIHKPAVRMTKGNNDSLIAQGLYLWNGDYIRDWIFTEFNYGYSDYISWIDEDGDTYRGKVNRNFSEITGAVYLGDSISVDTLNFIRADKRMETRLFYPFVPENNKSNGYNYHQPPEGNDGLKTAPIYNYISDTAAFNKLMNKILQQEYGRIESILVLKNDQLIIEEYFYGYSKDELHKIFSCTKSVVSLLLGKSLENHKKINLNQSIFDFFPAYDSLRSLEKNMINVSHVLTMTSGFEWIENSNPFTETGIVIHDILSLPLESPPGKEFRYSDGNTDIIGGIIEHLEGKPLNEFAEENLFLPLGIKDFEWEEYSDGSKKCGAGLHLYPRDMAKIGSLVLNEGKWKNKQIFEKNWIMESTEPSVTESEYFHYGYQWWHHSNLDNHWWSCNHDENTLDHNVVLAVGWGGQYIIIQKELNLVCVITASNYNSDEKAFDEIPMVIEEIFPLFVN